MGKGRNYVLARVLLTMSTGSIAITTDTWNLLASVGYVSGKYTLNFNDDWSYISGSATVLNELDDFAKLVSPSYTKGSCSVKCIVSDAGTVQEINGVAIQIDLVLER
jgi:hypothetical protein